MTTTKRVLLGLATSVTLWIAASAASAQTLEYREPNGTWSTVVGSAPYDAEFRVSADPGMWVFLMIHAEIENNPSLPPDVPTWLLPPALPNWTTHVNFASAAGLGIDEASFGLFASLVTTDFVSQTTDLSVIRSFCVPILESGVPVQWDAYSPVWTNATYGNVSNDFWSAANHSGSSTEFNVNSLFREAIHLRAFAHTQPIEEATHLLESDIFREATSNTRPAKLRLQVFGTYSSLGGYYPSHPQVPTPASTPAPLIFGPSLDFPLNLKASTITTGFGGFTGKFTLGQQLQTDIVNLIPPATVYFSTNGSGLISSPVVDISTAGAPDRFSVSIPDGAVPGPIYFDDGRDQPMVQVGTWLP